MKGPYPDKKISILIASESKNAYVSEIANGLSRFFRVKRSVKDFLERQGTYDIIHIQWPEEITGWDIPSDTALAKVDKSLQYWSKKAKIVITRHNILPNKHDPAKYEPLYDLVYSYADAVIHLGKQSLNEYIERYPGHSKGRLQKVIQHHIYESYPNTVSRDAARKYLHVSEKDAVILCFGTIRSKKQFRMVISAYRGLKISHKCLIVPRYKASGYISRRYILKRIRLALKQWYFRTFFNVVLGTGFIEGNDIQYYFNAADAVLVPRTEQLNSGVVFLAKAFNKPVTAPSKGNMEEVLRFFGYPVFNPEDNASVISALRQLLEMPEGNRNQLPDKNFDCYTLQYSIAEHKELYFELYEANIRRNK